jgi:hypothetical protein
MAEAKESDGQMREKPSEGSLQRLQARPGHVVRSDNTDLNSLHHSRKVGELVRHFDGQKEAKSGKEDVDYCQNAVHNLVMLLLN